MALITILVVVLAAAGARTYNRRVWRPARRPTALGGRPHQHRGGALIEDGTITPIIDASFDFEHAPAAHRRLTERKNIGKVALTP